MAISERAPGTQSPEHKPLPCPAAVASYVASVVENLQQDRQTIPNPFEVCRRVDMAMVAMLEVVAPVLPQIVKEQVNQLISIHDAVYQAAKPSAEQRTQEHDH